MLGRRSLIAACEFWFKKNITRKKIFLEKINRNLYDNCFYPKFEVFGGAACLLSMIVYQFSTRNETDGTCDFECEGLLDIENVNPHAVGRHS